MEKSFNINGIILSVFIFFCFSCNKTLKERLFQGKTLVEVKKDSLGNKINFVSCAVTTLKYKFTEDKIYFQPRMDEEFVYIIKETDVYNDSIIFKTTLLTNEKAKKNIKFLKIDNLYWKIDDPDETILFTYKIHAETLPYIEQPCIECFEQEFCEALTKDELETFDGEWKFDCLSDQIPLTGLKPISEFYMDFTFNDDEYAKIIATVVKDLKEEGNYLLKYNMLTGITRGNRSLDWFNFSKDSIIAEIHLINEDKLEFSWKGFYNEKVKQRESINYVFSDYYDNPIILEKCNN